MTSVTVGRRSIMSGSQVDRLCQDWLQENCGESTASQYAAYSLVIPMWDSTDLNDAPEDLKPELCFSLGPEQSLGTADYYEAREKLGLSNDRTSIPGVFVRAFA